MAILLQTRLKVRWVELQVRSVRRRHGFKVGKAAYAVHHVALEPKKSRKGECECYPNGSPCACLTYRHLVCFLVYHEHVEHKNGGYKDYEAAQKHKF